MWCARMVWGVMCSYVEYTFAGSYSSTSGNADWRLDLVTESESPGCSMVICANGVSQSVQGVETRRKNRICINGRVSE